MEDQKYGTTALQLVFLTLNILSLQETGYSNFTLGAILIIVMLYALQTVNKRFFYFFPANQGIPTPKNDTKILYASTIAYIALSLGGLASPRGNFASLCFASLGVAVTFGAPFIWRNYFHEKNRDMITEDLQRMGHEILMPVQCEKCGCQSARYAKILDKNRGVIGAECPRCGAPIHKEIVLNIGQ